MRNYIEETKSNFLDAEKWAQRDFKLFLKKKEQMYLIEVISKKQSK
jgi:hypothetical protein